MQHAELIVSRSGYTTLMDLAAIQRSALIIPTPGQPEQEYLGDLHARTGRFLVQGQEAIDLAAALTWAPPKCAPLMEAPLLAQALKDLGDLLGR
jgi:predicted glycosyltransferase